MAKKSYVKLSVFHYYMYYVDADGRAGRFARGSNEIRSEHLLTIYASVDLMEEIILLGEQFYKVYSIFSKPSIQIKNIGKVKEGLLLTRKQLREEINWLRKINTFKKQDSLFTKITELRIKMCRLIDGHRMFMDFSDERFKSSSSDEKELKKKIKKRLDKKERGVLSRFERFMELSKITDLKDEELEKRGFSFKSLKLLIVSYQQIVSEMEKPDFWQQREEKKEVANKKRKDHYKLFAKATTLKEFQTYFEQCGPKDPKFSKSTKDVFFSFEDVKERLIQLIEKEDCDAVLDLKFLFNLGVYFDDSKVYTAIERMVMYLILVERDQEIVNLWMSYLYIETGSLLRDEIHSLAKQRLKVLKALVVLKEDPLAADLLKELKTEKA